MQNSLDNNDVLMYFTYNERKSVVAEGFIRTSKGKIFKKYQSTDSKSYLSFLDKVAD